MASSLDFVENVCDQISGAELLTSAEEASPYSGAKPHFLIECLEDREFLADFIRKTCDELPVPRPKKKKTII